MARWSTAILSMLCSVTPMNAQIPPQPIPQQQIAQQQIAQQPIAQQPIPLQPIPPQPLPPTVLAKREAPVKLPRLENLQSIDPKTLAVKRLGGDWQIWVNDAVFKSFGDNVDDANDVARTLRELYPLRWGTIGTDRVVVEYGLTADNDQKLVAPQVAGFARSLTAMDMTTLRVERVRGMWCLRDEANLLLNFGQHKMDAEQALAVAKKYGFNRIGTVGRREPAMTFFTSAPDLLAPVAASLPSEVSFRMQVNAMTRTGIPLPVYGIMGERKAFDPNKVEYVGEMIPIDPRKCELRTVGRELVLACGRDVLARFDENDGYMAREAQRAVRDARLTEFCSFGTAGVTFFLSNGQAPRNLPMHALGNRFDLSSLRIVEARGQFYVAEANGKLIAPAGSRDEAETLIRLMRAFGFDQIATFASRGKPAMTVFVKSR